MADAKRRCNHSSFKDGKVCEKEGYDIYDYYGIYAGRYCEDHESEAPGQFAYAGADTEPLEEED